MPRQPKMLNVREHLKHVQIVLDGYKEYGDCPAVQEEMRRLSAMNKAILRKHQGTREKGNRKDLRVEAESP